MDKQTTLERKFSQNRKELYREKALRLAIVNSNSQLKSIYDASASFVPNFEKRFLYTKSFYDFEYKVNDCPFQRFYYSPAHLLELHETMNNLYFKKTSRQYEKIFNDNFFSAPIFGNIIEAFVRRDARINKLRFFNKEMKHHES